MDAANRHEELCLAEFSHFLNISCIGCIYLHFICTPPHTFFAGLKSSSAVCDCASGWLLPGFGNCSIILFHDFWLEVINNLVFEKHLSIIQFCASQHFHNAAVIYLIFFQKAGTVAFWDMISGTQPYILRKCSIWITTAT